MIVDEIIEENYSPELVEKGEKAVYEKFKIWEALKKKAEISEKPIFENPESRAKAAGYLRDPTFWAHALLFDKQGRQLNFRHFQDRLVNDAHRFVLCVAANQIGKTWAICVKSIHHALNVNSASVLIVSNSETQSINVLDEIKWMLQRASISFSTVITDVDNRTELHLRSPDGKGVSVIRCFAPTTRILGFPATLIICDEFAFWEIEKMTERTFFSRVILSRINETKNWSHDFLTMGQVVIISNPNGERGEFYRIWKEDERFHKYRYFWLANPSNSMDEYKEAKKNMLSFDFDSVYGARFSSSKGGFILREEYNEAEIIEDTIIPTDKTIHLGLDKTGEDTVSKQTDDSILTAFYDINEGIHDKSVFVQCYKKEWKGNTFMYHKDDGTKGNEIYDEISRFSNSYQVSGISYDKPGVGDAVKNDLINLKILPEYKINSLTYSTQNKTNVYNNMKFLFEQRRIRLIIDEKQREQFMGLHFERLDSGNMKVHHKKEGLHDDYPDAVANALFQATGQRSSASVSFIAHEPVNQEISQDSAKVSLRKAVLCKQCDIYKYSSQPDKHLCDECYILE